MAQDYSFQTPISQMKMVYSFLAGMLATPGAAIDTGTLEDVTGVAYYLLRLFDDNLQATIESTPLRVERAPRNIGSVSVHISFHDE